MKKLIFILAMVLGVLTLKAQVIQQDSTNLVTVKDTSYIQDARLNYMINTIKPAIDRFVEDYNSKSKVDGKEITFKQETNQLIKKFKKIVEDYQANFISIKDVQVDSVKVIEEFNKLNTRIAEIDADEEIKLSDAKKEIARIKERQLKLVSYYNQIINN